jgi:hypothetical protein
MRTRIVFAFVFICLILVGCQPKVSEIQCPIETLILDESEFPKNTQIDRIYSPISMSRESADRTFIIGADTGIQAIARFTYKRSAKYLYYEKRRDFYDGDSWVKASDLFFDDHADRYYAACGELLGSKRCVMIAQYGEYFTFLSTSVSQEDITHGVFLSLAKKIDQKITSCVGK